MSVPADEQDQGRAMAQPTGPVAPSGGGEPPSAPEPGPLGPGLAFGTSPSLSLPRPEEISQRERDDAMGAYLMMFASWAVGLPFPFINLIASWIYYLVNRKGSRFVAFNSYQALLVHLPVAVYNALIIIWLLVALIGGHNLSGNFLPAAILGAALNILYIVFSIKALRRAVKGIFYYIPWAGRPAFGHFYGPKALAREARRRRLPEENRPPRGFET